MKNIKLPLMLFIFFILKIPTNAQLLLGSGIAYNVKAKGFIYHARVGTLINKRTEARFEIDYYLDVFEGDPVFNALTLNFSYKFFRRGDASFYGFIGPSLYASLPENPIGGNIGIGGETMLFGKLKLFSETKLSKAKTVVHRSIIYANYPQFIVNVGLKYEFGQ